MISHSEAEAVAKSSFARLFLTTGNSHGRILIANEIVEVIANFLNAGANN